MLIGLALRGLWLDWQPLWWDEGYSAYIATEPLARMVWLTAHDIHPPLYYGLLQGWIALAGTTSPVHLRLFSVLAGFAALPLLAWFTQVLFPKKNRVILLALLLLAISPMHIYYSQEIRMYALAMTLGLVSSTFAWRLLIDEANTSRQNIIGYAISAALCLYTLYFSILLLAAHFLWAAWCKCRRERLHLFIYAQVIAFILYLPWLIYVTPKLVLYITDKVSVEKDISLGFFHYIWRHLWAFVNGHIPLGYAQKIDSWNTLAYIGPLAAILLLLIFIVRQYHSSQRHCHSVVHKPNPTHLIFALLIVPSLGGFIINYLWPFFPIGGERMLLFVLPYFLVLLAVAIDRWLTSRYAYIIWSVLIGLLFCAGLAIITFYTTPRHVENDYRPLIRQVIQQGRAEDTMLALFPWQVGYWRAYLDNNGEDESSPQPLLINDGIIQWDDTLIRAVEQALEQGTLWFPEPRAFGSTLPAEIRAYLRPMTTNLEDRWYTPTTLLSAWHKREKMEPQALGVNFGSVRLEKFSVQPTTVASANQPLHVDLWWVAKDSVDTKLYGTLRLQDANGHTWASRDYLLLSNLDNNGQQDPGVKDQGVKDQGLNRVGLIVPAGLAPSLYRLMFGIGQDEKLIIPKNNISENTYDPLIQLAEVQITQPAQPLSRFQLPIQRPLNPPVSHKGLQLLGASGIAPNSRLAGTEMSLTLFFHNQESQQHISEQHVYVSILDRYGTGVGGWEGWTLPDYPIEQWPQNALAQVPIRFPLPATLEAGPHRLVAGLVEPERGVKTSFTLLGRLMVTRRPTNFTPTAPEHMLEHAVQFGTHVQLRGYDYQHSIDGIDTTTVTVTLHWSVMETLLPDHHIFVHLNRAGNSRSDDRENGSVENSQEQTTLVESTTIVQDDGLPTYGGMALPSGSWLAGEYLQTTHILKFPPDLQLEDRGIYLYVGLYEPKTLARLPATIEGQPVGDSALLQP